MSFCRSSLVLIAMFGIAAGYTPQLALAGNHETLTPGEATQVGMVSAWQLPLAISGGHDAIVDSKIHVDRTRMRVLFEVSVDGQVLVRVPADTLEVDTGNIATLAAAASGVSAAEADNSPNRKSPEALGVKRREYEYVVVPDGTRQARIKGTGEVVWVEEKGGIRFPLRSGGKTGLPANEKEAERLAKMEAYKLKRFNKEAVVTRIEVPQVRMYALGSDGTLECRDAETGRVIWVGRYGNSRIPTFGISVTDDLVAFANGSTLIVVNALDGKIVTEYHLNSVPVTSPTIVGEHVMVACSNRKIEGYALKDIGGERFTAVAAGLPLADATRAPGAERMMWPTDSGFVYAIDGIGKPNLVFRFPADGLVTGKLAASTGERFFMASDKGQVYGISAARNGSLMWRQSLGEPVYASPVLVGERVLVQTVYGRVYCLDVNDGSLVWPSPLTQIAKVLGGTKNQVFVRTRTEHLEVVELETGSISVEFFATHIVDAVENPFTDRLYLITTNGSVQCLRPAANELPVMMLPDAPPAAGQTDGQNKPQGTKDGAGDGKGTDPFGLQDIQGGGAGAPDPFGGSDPFGGGADDGSNPFGGGKEDPFGGF